jgi:predicted metal-binding membrane protein
MTRDRVPAIGIWAALLALAALGWAATVFASHSMSRMADMSGMPGMSAASSPALAFLSVWTAMMVAMMFPSLAPVVATAGGDGRLQAGRRAARTLIFLIGYLAVWAAVGVGAYVLSLIAPDVRMAAPGLRGVRPVIAGLVLAVAGVYQWSPLKKLFLGRCRSPLDLARCEWGTGAIGAFRLGIAHGAQCVGCCGGLMLALFAVGVMSLSWMALVAAVIFAEKVVPQGPSVGKLAGAALLAFGVVTLGA